MPRKNSGPRLKFREDRGVWVITWSEFGATRLRSTGSADRGQADQAFAEFLNERLRDTAPIGPSDPGAFPIADALILYAGHAETKSDPARIGFAIKALLPFWGARMVADITRETCRAYERSRSKAPGTVRRELGALRAALNYAYGEGRVTRVPVVHLPEKPQGRDRWLTLGEAAKLLNEARKANGRIRLYLPLFIILALNTGARKEAILSLRWSQVDFSNGLIDFNPPGRQRTKKGRAIVPISPKLMGHLKRARRRGSDLGYVINAGGSRIKDIGHRTGGSFGAACRRSGLVDVTPHTLRHTCGTWAAQRGVPLWQIAGWLGQSNARTTELYAHHHPDHLLDAMHAADRRRA